MNIGLQTVNYVEHEEHFKHAIEIRATAFEIFFHGFTPNDIKPSFKSTLKKAADTVFLTVHSPIISLVSRKNMEFFNSCLDFANEYGARIYTIHGDISTSKGIRNLEILIKKAQDYDIKIGLENTFITTNTINEIYNKFKHYNNVGITFDIGHAGIYDVSDEIKESNALKYLKNIAGPIIEVHAHNNNGKEDEHRRINDGVIEFEPLLRYLVDKLEFEGPIILEYLKYQAEEDIKFIKDLISN